MFYLFDKNNKLVCTCSEKPSDNYINYCGFKVLESYTNYDGNPNKELQDNKIIDCIDVERLIFNKLMAVKTARDKNYNDPIIYKELSFDVDSDSISRLTVAKLELEAESGAKDWITADNKKAILNKDDIAFILIAVSKRNTKINEQYNEYKYSIELIKQQYIDKKVQDSEIENLLKNPELDWKTVD